MELRLVLPTYFYIKKIEDFKNELIENNSSWEGTCCLRNSSAKEFIVNCKKWRQNESLTGDNVPSTEFLAVRKTDDRIVGMVNLRHSIAPTYLNQFGGHIGYCVRPTERHKGYCVDMLHLALDECIKMGIDRVLLTCISDNIPSKKCILSNGGVYENTVQFCQDNYSFNVDRFWVNTR